MAQKPEKQADVARPAEWTGTIERFTFRNPETGFAVVRFVPTDGSGPLQAVGQLAQLVEGQQVKLRGKTAVHPRFGAQIDVQSAEATLPQSEDGIRAYLASSLVKGVGPATAERIVGQFGVDALRVIEEEPDRLREVRGLGQKRIDDLVMAVRAQRDVQEVMVFLRTHGLGQALATRIVRRFGANASALIQANPFRLADEVIGIGFRTADQLARNLGIAADAPERLQAGITHVLSQAAREGHCFLPRSDLEVRTVELLGCPPTLVEPALAALATDRRVVVREQTMATGDAVETIYPIALEQAEHGAAVLLTRLIEGTDEALPVDPERALAWFERESSMELPEGQRHAVLRALTEPVSVITGGPGVGKTTIIRALAEILAARDLTLLLAAPTGRAAKRLEESTGRGARTIHRLLEYQAGIGRFLRDTENPLEGHMLVVDEVSMLDIVLAHDLLRAIPPGLRLVLVGDADQLPAVGPGNVLDDVIASQRFPVTRLTQIFRQHGASRIVSAAHEVLEGVVPLTGAEGSDFFLVETKDSAQTRRVIRELVTQRIPKAFGLDALRDIQVLCPMYRGDAGADAINADLQDTLNPSREQIERGSRTFREGDKVMQIQNDYDLDVYNGDVGQIARIDRENSFVHVDFGERLIPYPYGELDQLVPAYAISVHRSQGSEYPAIVVPLATEHFMMLKRKLLYTAMTRGKRLVVLVGSPKALAMAVNNRGETRRYSGLAERLRSSRA